MDYFVNLGKKIIGLAEVLQSKKTILVWNCPKGSSCSLLNPFGSLCNVDKPSMLGHFWSKVDHFWAIPTPQSWTVDPRVKKGLSPGLFCIAYLQNPNTPRLKHKCGRNLWKMSQKKGQNSMRKWPFFAIILLWMASYGSERSFLLIFSARDDLVKVSWKSDAGKCQNQLTPPYFDQLSERHQPLWPNPDRQHQNMMIICVAYSDDPRLVRAALSTNGRWNSTWQGLVRQCPLTVVG